MLQPPTGQHRHTGGSATLAVGPSLTLPYAYLTLNALDISGEPAGPSACPRRPLDVSPTAPTLGVPVQVVTTPAMGDDADLVRASTNTGPDQLSVWRRERPVPATCIVLQSRYLRLVATVRLAWSMDAPAAAGSESPRT
jgi:hypothetical protein